MAKNTQIKARNANSEIHLSHSQVDTPLLDVTSLEKLQLGALIGMGSIAGAIYSAVLGFETLAGIIASVGLGSLAVAFLRRDKQ